MSGFVKKAKMSVLECSFAKPQMIERQSYWTWN